MLQAAVWRFVHNNMVTTPNLKVDCESATTICVDAPSNVGAVWTTLQPAWAAEYGKHTSSPLLARESEYTATR